MSFKHSVGTAINDLMETMIVSDYRSVPFIPNGRIMPLDLKRASADLRTIFDVGGNEGQTANYYAKHFKSAAIYTFEPVLEVYRSMVKNTGANERIKCFNKALGNENGQAKIFKSTNYSGVASINGETNNALPDQEIIQVSTGLSVCEEYQISCIDLLKIDTEGYEINVLDGFKSMLKSGVKFIYVEASFDPFNTCQTHIARLLDYLYPYGFIVSGLYAMHRSGRAKLKLSHCDILLTNTGLVEV